ncbi:unnamed protein product [Bursaphelenchus xylophilus]|uniref:(pine wood nematode) hypothetical protein n=1 Tax=Bursaphelenchus xylophilus TaxID=6326 RepID=A0A1I7RTI2_BURXY|nr:unnamed protein product [Bursaphelenchus xylophilus]CAG9122442.1 unnamed protein product [Bursaphelenchus xylophilus]
MDAETYYCFTIFYRVFGIINLLLNTYITIKIARATVLHVNFRIVVCITIITLEMMHISYVLGHYYNSVTLQMTERYYANIGCAIFALLNNISSASGTISMFMLALERHIAHKYVNLYEDKPNTLGCVLVIIVAVQSAFIGIVSWWFFLFHLDEFNLETSRISCITTDLHWEWGVCGFSLAAIMCVFGAMWLVFLKSTTHRHRMSRVALSSLSARFQATENSYTTASIAPSMIFFAIGSIIGICICLSRGKAIQQYGQNSILSKFLADVAFMVVDVYALIHLACLLLYNPMIRNIVKRDLERIACLGISTPPQAFKADYQVETEVYFNQFRTAWAKEKGKTPVIC